MTTFFCPKCWAQVAESASVCPECGTDIAQWKAEHDYADQLIAALRHPIPTTQVLAAEVLGERREKKAVPALIETLNTTGDAYLAAAAVEALSKIGSAEAIDTVRAALQHRFVGVRARAREGLANSVSLAETRIDAIHS
jgi:HEAT repeat protein